MNESTNTAVKHIMFRAFALFEFPFAIKKVYHVTYTFSNGRVLDYYFKTDPMITFSKHRCKGFSKR